MHYMLFSLDQFKTSAIATKLQLHRLETMYPEATHVVKDMSQARNKIRKKTLRDLSAKLLGIVGGSSNKYSVAAVTLLEPEEIENAQEKKKRIYKPKLKGVYDSYNYKESYEACVDIYRHPDLGEIHYYENKSCSVWVNGKREKFFTVVPELLPREILTNVLNEVNA